MEAGKSGLFCLRALRLSRVAYCLTSLRESSRIFPGYDVLYCCGRIEALQTKLPVLHPEDRSSMDSRNTGTLPQHYTGSHQKSTLNGAGIAQLATDCMIGSSESWQGREFFLLSRPNLLRGPPSLLSNR
jgi:hypothetical protein